jgi:hypothetical protein
LSFPKNENGNYLMTTGGVPANRILITTAEKPALDAYTEKPKYKIDMTLPGTEKPEAQ